MNNLIELTVLIFVLIAYSIRDATCELKLLNVVFRHGDRSPDGSELDLLSSTPYSKNSFWPLGLGELTGGGKLREYHLGEYLRERYGYFLGDFYVSEQVSARSTNFDRTKMSLQLVLAALFPPKGSQKWNNNVNWQPIPTYTLSKLDDILMRPEECPKYLKAREKVEASAEFKAKLNAFASFMQELSSNTGTSISDSNDMYLLYHALMAERSMNLTLPEWSNGIFPDGRLLDGINLEYEIFSYNVEMRRLNGGMLVREFINNMDEHRNGNNNPHDDRNRKIFLYGGHETNVAAVLQALGVYQPHVPEYTSAVIIELHEVNNKYLVKVLHYNGIARTKGKIDEEVSVPGCDSHRVCSLDKFKSVLTNVTATDDDITSCDKRSLRQSFAKNRYHIAPGIIKQLLGEFDADDKLRKKLLY